MQSPFISILMPVKNTDVYLNECIESIQQQSYSNWELIAINDHSSDESLAILETFALNDARIKVYTNNGNGIIEALRFAFSKSKGDLITRMDSDDKMHPEKLVVLKNLLLEKGKGHLATGLVRYFSEEGISDGYQKYEHWLNTLTTSGKNFSELYKECVIPSPCWMVFKSDLLASGSFESDRYPEDYDLTFRFYEQNLKCIPCTKLLHYWRDYPSRTSRTHIHYAQNYFLEIKMHYFLKLHHQKERSLTVWGAGNKGKTVAKNLLKNGIPFSWICDNPKKIGRDIYGQTMLPFSYLETLQHPQCIITVANTSAQKEIQTYLNKKKFLPMLDYFFFC